jgi:hypothetical protein
MLYQQARRPFPPRHPALTGAAALVAIWWVANGWYAAIAITALMGLAIFVTKHRRAHAIRDAGLRARADYEHRLSLAGDQRGVFGRYPPVQAGWFRDPQNPWQLRYFDGAMWTRHTR